jgi:hypothetical protein
MAPKTDAIVGRRHSSAALLNSVSRTALAALTMGLALGVMLPGEAHAQCVVNPVQGYTYVLSLCGNPITFGPKTNININPFYPTGMSGVANFYALVWNVTNLGNIQGWSQGPITAGIFIASPGSTVTNIGTINGNGANGVGVELGGLLFGTGTVRNSGTIGGTLDGVYISGYGGGAVSNSGTITGGNVGVLVNHPSAFGASVTNAGSITGGYQAFACWAAAQSTIRAWERSAATASGSTSRAARAP